MRRERVILITSFPEVHHLVINSDQVPFPVPIAIRIRITQLIIIATTDTSFVFSSSPVEIASATLPACSRYLCFC